MTESVLTNFVLELRHSPCLMRPVTLIILIIMILFWFFTAILNFPSLVIGFILSPIALSRGTWLIEFLYPLGIARWGHLLLIRLTSGSGSSSCKDKANRYHSRTLEQRIEVVLGRVFIHPLPQLLDNLGYLVVCLPPPPTQLRTTATSSNSNDNHHQHQNNKVSIETQQENNAPIVAFVVDCGDATVVQEQIEMIIETHYKEYCHNQNQNSVLDNIQIHMILSTHKHHDHTAGNTPFKKLEIGKHLKVIVGGAVEKVPGCNYPVADGELLPLPKDGCNDMNDVVEVEAIAAPAHTRGSIVYALRPKQHSHNREQEQHEIEELEVDEYESSDLPAPCFVFTGDTMFSGGGGVPFEAGSHPDIENGQYGNNVHGHVRAGVGLHAVERCFAEILVRSMLPSMQTTTNSYNYWHLNDYLALMNDRFLVFPGHEYTTELLTRQLGGSSLMDANKWKNFAPHVFFETVSQLYVAMHRRSLPQATGRLIAAAPTTLRRELAINPHLRSLTKRGELVLQAIRLWHHYFSKPKSPADEEAAIRLHNNGQRSNHDPLAGRRTMTTTTMNPRRASSSSKTRKRKTPSKTNSWNMDTDDAAQSVFTTVYTSDLDAIIEDLDNGDINPEMAVEKLEGLKSKLQEPIVRRRPIPMTLPSEKNVYKGLIGLTLLGSRPSAMTLSDSVTMKLPPPVIKDSSAILISKKRLITVLGRLGLLGPDDGHKLVSMIDDLWEEAIEFADIDIGGGTTETTTATPKWLAEDTSEASVERDNNTAEVDSHSNKTNDTVELGALKWILYGYEARQPTWFSRYCMPCGGSSSQQTQPEHPSHSAGMKRQHGELVRHDILTCKLCRMAAGQGSTANKDETTVIVDNGYECSAMIIQHSDSTANASVDSAATRPDETAVGDDDQLFVEVSRIPSSMLTADQEN